MTESTDRSFRVAIKGWFGHGNFGDDLLMLAAHRVVQQAFPTEPIGLIGNDAAYVQRLLPCAPIHSAAHSKALTLDLLVYGGGTQFYSFGTKYPFLLASAGRWISRLVTPADRGFRSGNRPSGQSSTRTVALGVGVGPFLSRGSAFKRTRRVFAEMRYVAVRDQASYKQCKEWGRDVTLGADLCFMPGFWSSYCAAPSQRPLGLREIGVVVRDWPHTTQGESYVEPLFRVVDELRAAGKRVRFISFCGSDSRVHDRLHARGESYVVWNPTQQSPTDFVDTLTEFDAFVTARYHGAVIASLLGRPVVCVEVEQKLRLFSELLGDGSRLWTYPFSAAKCVSLVSSLERNQAQAVISLAAVVREQNYRAQLMIDEFRHAVARGDLQLSTPI